MTKGTESTLTYLAGDEKIVGAMPGMPVRPVYDEEVMAFLDAVSSELMGDPANRAYPDVVTFAFWIRRSALTQRKKRFLEEHTTPGIRTGVGTLFHVAPSNVPVNFAYSLTMGLLAGNANIVRVSSQPFPQTQIIADAMCLALQKHEGMKPYLALVRYGHEKEINDRFSGMADVRVVWGGDRTIRELRNSPLPARGTEITFADRYSLSVIDAEVYLQAEDKERIAKDFYNDTYFSDQNACTSPRAVVWIGRDREKAREVFWKTLYDLAAKDYTYQDLQGVNKLSAACLCAAVQDCVMEEHADNLLIRLSTPRLTREILEHRENSGFFIECDCDDLMELREVCDDRKCQTIGILGDRKILEPLLRSGIRGVDRVVPIGHTMDFDTVWDGYDLICRMSRVITI